jgi:hypothetical protein
MVELIQTIRTSAAGLKPHQRAGRSVPDPIDRDLDLTVKQYITALRELYDVSDLRSYNEIHSAHGFQPSFTSRSLGGKRVNGTPNDRRFRTMLVEAWARRCAVSETTRREVDVKVAILHHEAVKACSEANYRRMITEEDLAAAVHEREAAWEHIQELTRRLERQQTLQQHLEERIRQLTTGTGTHELGHRHRRLVDDRQRLLEQILALRLTLRRAQDAQAQAEARCITLESELLRLKARDLKPVNGAEYEQRHIDGRAASEARQEQLAAEIKTIIDENDRLEALIKEVSLDTEQPLAAGEPRKQRVHRAMCLLGMAESDNLNDHPQIIVKLNEILQLLNLPPLTGHPHDDWLSPSGQGI